jgi:hypothetical protein
MSWWTLLTILPPSPRILFEFAFLESLGRETYANEAAASCGLALCARSSVSEFQPGEAGSLGAHYPHRVGHVEDFLTDGVWNFCAMIMPLRIQGGSGSPVRPVAIGAPSP